MDKSRSRVYDKSGSWIQSRKGDKDNADILSAITESCLDRQVLRQHYQITSTSLYLNSRMEQNFTLKEVELQKVLKQKPSQMFAFGLVRTEVQATEVCEKSAFKHQVLHVPLGNTLKGVNVVQHADVLMNWAVNKGFQRPWLIVYRIMKGRCKEVKPRLSPKAPQEKPTPNIDSHACIKMKAKSGLIHNQLNQSQIYLYDMVDAQGNCRRHPRHCLPYAVVSYKLRPVSLPRTLSNPDSNKRRLLSTGREKTSTAGSDKNRRKSVSDLSGNTSPLSQNEEVALSKFLETSSLSMKELDSTHLDSKLDEIKQEREMVMLKLKAIQNMREAIASGSCTSESEQELDKTLDQIGSDQKMTNDKGFASPAAKVGRSGDDMPRMETSSMSHDGVKNLDHVIHNDALDVDEPKIHHVNDLNERSLDSLDGEHGQGLSRDADGYGNSQDPMRPGRSGSSCGWRDPFHWQAPHMGDSMMDFRGSMNDHFDDRQQLDYYNMDEQSDMFDLDELFYAAQSKLAKRVPPIKLKTNSIAEKQDKSICQAATLISSNTKVEDMEIDESSLSSLSHGSNTGAGFETQQGMHSDSITSQGFEHKSFKPTEASVTNMDIDGQNYDNLPSFDTYKGNTQPLSTSPGFRHMTPETNRDNVCQNYGTPEPRGVNPSNHLTPSPGLSHTTYNHIDNIKSPGSNNNIVCQNYGDSKPKGDASNFLTPPPAFSHPTYNPMDVIPSPGPNTRNVGQYDSSPEYGSKTSKILTRPPAFSHPTCNPMQDMPSPTPNTGNVGQYGSSPEYSNTLKPLTPSPGFSYTSFNKPMLDMPTPGTNSNNVCQNYGSAVLEENTSHHMTNSPQLSHTSYNPMEDLRPPGTNNVIVCPSYVTPELKDISPNHTCNSMPYNPVAEVGAQERKISIVCQNYSSPESIHQSEDSIQDPVASQGYNPSIYTSPSDVCAQGTGTSITCQTYDAQNSPDKPSSDFHSSQVISCGTDGRLRLAPTVTKASTMNHFNNETTTEFKSTLPIPMDQLQVKPSNDFQRSLLPKSTDEYVEAKMSPPQPLMPHFEYESNLIAIDPNDIPTKTPSFDTVTETGISSAPPLSTATVTSAMPPPADGAKLSQGTMSAILALQQEMDQTDDAIQRCALRVAMNTLLANPPVATAKPKDKLIKLPDAATPIPKAKKIKLFYGYPLIKKGKKPPRVIPLDFESGNDPQPWDPRPARSTKIGRNRMDVYLGVLPWAKYDQNRKQDALIVNTGCDKIAKPDNTSSNQSTANKPNIRDPRICKQILNNALNTPSIPKKLPVKRAILDSSSKSVESVDDDIELLGTYKPSCGYGGDTPESGELCDSPIYQDTRTVVVIREDHPASRDTGNYEGAPGESTPTKIMEKLRYVQDLSASKPKLLKQRKVVVHKAQETVFERLGNQKISLGENANKQNFDLRHKIKGKKIPPLTGYNIRDQFLHSESSNDSVVELKAPLMPQDREETYTNSFKWFNRDISEQKEKSSYEVEMESYTQARNDLRQKLSRENEHNRVEDKYRRERSVDRQSMESDRLSIGSDRRSMERDRRSMGSDRRSMERGRWSMERDRRSMENQRRSMERGRWSMERDRRSMERDRRSIERDQRSMERDRQWSRDMGRRSRRTSRERDNDKGRGRYEMDEDRSRSKYAKQRSLSIDGSSQRSLSTDMSSKRSWSLDGSSQQSLSIEGSSQESIAKDRCLRSASNRGSVSPGNVEIKHTSSSIYSRRHPDKTSTHENISDARKTPVSRGSSVGSCGQDLGASNRTDSLGERLEKEHGVPQCRKRRHNESKPQKNKAGQPPDRKQSYKDLSGSLSALKQSVNNGMRSFKELNKTDLHSRIRKYKDRYKDLQDLSIRALECHYQQDRAPTDLDTTIQQCLLEMITDIELQMEVLDKYETTKPQNSESFSRDYSKQGIGNVARGRGQSSKRGRSDGRRQKTLDPKTSPELANEMYDMWQNQKYGTNSPARSTSGSTQKRRCP